MNGCRVIKSGGGGSEESSRGLHYERGISAESVDAHGLCMHLGLVPPGGVAAAHEHDGHGAATDILSGRAGVDFGRALEHRLEMGAGDFSYIDAGVPHRPFSLSETEPVRFVVARTDPNEEESVVLLPELE